MAESPPGATGRHDVAPRAARWLLLVLGAGYLVAQLTLFSLHRARSWDEAVYISQVSPHAPATVFAPSRARGITLLVAPVVAAGGSTAAVRLFLAVASSAALAGAFRLWVPVIGVAAPLAGFLLAFSWLGLFYGSEAVPNLWAAILAVAATGALCRALDGRVSVWTLWAGVFLALLGVMRPPDALVLFTAMVVGIVLFARRSLRAIGVLLGGLVAGWVPWLIEMSARFGGPARAFRLAGSAGHISARSLAHRVFQHLALTDGPPLGPEGHAHVPAVGVLWWGGLVALSATALLRSRGTPGLRALALASVGGLALAAEYLGFVSGLAPRFLLPAYALLSVLAAAGLVSLARGRRVARAAAALSAALVVVWAVVQAGIAHRIEVEQVQERGQLALVGEDIRRAAAGRPCVVASSSGFPQIQLASGCEARPYPAGGGVAAELRRLRRGGRFAFVVLPAGNRGPLPPIARVGSLSVFRLPLPGK